MTKNQLKKKYLLDGLNSFLKEKGFRRNASTFKKETENGLFQIIQLNLGPSWSTKQGEVAIAFGIYTIEWRNFFQSCSKSSNITASDCEIDGNRSALVDKDFRHKWYKINRWYMPNKHLDGLIREMTFGIDKNVLPFFERHNTRPNILKSYARFEKSIGLPPRHKLSIAILNCGIGNFDLALKLAEEESKKFEDNSFYTKVYAQLESEIRRNVQQNLL